MTWNLGRRVAGALAIGVVATACSDEGQGTANLDDAGSSAGGQISSTGGTSPGGNATAGGFAGAPASGTGGRGSGTGGAPAAGGSSNGGSVGAGGAGDGGAGGNGTGGVSSGCKRGIAANTAPGAAFFPAIAWWYNWAMQPSGADVGVEFVPMIWGSGSLGAAVPSGSSYLLTFNEPNFHAQSNLTAEEAASHWPEIEAKATAAGGIPIVGPGMNYCGPASNCNGTSPYQYLKDFFAACSGCKVDYVAVHWYNCDLPSLRDYLEPGNNLEGFEQFGKPIWLTEFSCDGGASVAEQEAFMREAIPYLEGNPNVFRYSWFSAGPIPNARLIESDGSPTALGNVYIGLDQSCP